MLKGKFLICAKSRNYSEKTGNTYYSLTVSGDGIDGVVNMDCDGKVYEQAIAGQYMNVTFLIRFAWNRLSCVVKGVEKC